MPRYLDPECVALVEGGVPETTALLAERFDHIFYTGGGAVGRVVMEAAAKHLTPVTLELGGKSPCIVDATADLDVAARRIAWGKFLNAGQTCIAPDYVLVDERREDELARAARRGGARVLRRRPEAEPGLRPHRERAPLRAAGARCSKDGEVAVGGRDRAASRATSRRRCCAACAPDADVMQEEIFGPILPVLPVRDLDAAIALRERRARSRWRSTCSARTPPRRRGSRRRRARAASA